MMTFMIPSTISAQRSECAGESRSRDQRGPCLRNRSFAGGRLVVRASRRRPHDHRAAGGLSRWDDDRTPHRRVARAGFARSAASAEKADAAPVSLTLAMHDGACDAQYACTLHSIFSAGNCGRAELFPAICRRTSPSPEGMRSGPDRGRPLDPR
jgi:hypothetical protein